MIHNYKCILVAIALALVASSESFAAVFHIVSTTDDAIYEVDLGTGEKSLFSTLPAGQHDGFAKLDPFTYLVRNRTNDTIQILSSVDGSLLRVVSVDNDMVGHPRGLAVSPMGQVFTIFPGLELHTVNLVTGETTFVASLDSGLIDNVEAFTFDKNGNLYLTGSDDGSIDGNALFMFDFQTLVTMKIGAIAVEDADALSFGADGYLYTVDALSGVVSDLYRIDPATGATENLGSTGVEGADGVIMTAPEIPAPPAFYLFAAGVAAFSSFRHRGPINWRRRSPLSGSAPRPPASLRGQGRAS